MSSGRFHEKLITGATDGIGLDWARMWRARGERPWLHGRRDHGELDPLLFEPERYLQADLADPAAPERIAKLLDEGGPGALDLLVLNAATGWVGALERLEPGPLRALLEVDLIAPLALCHRLLPRLRRARGRIVFVSSIAAGMAAPRYAAYGAAKAAAEGFFRSLSIELRGEVEVQVLRLGGVRTRLHEKSGLSRAEIPWERFPSAEAVVRAMERALARPASRQTLGFRNRAIHGLGRMLPGAADRWCRVESPGLAPVSNARRRCAITGAAHGIGLALARRFARAGFELVLIDVDGRAASQAKAELEHEGVRVELLLADMARPADVDGLIEELARRAPLDVFVHNAGINAVGRFGALSWKDQRRVLEVNLVAPLVLTGGLLRSERLTRDGAIVCISSLSHFVSYPGASVYAASKDGLAHFARSLRAALAPGGARVLTVYPGPTRTEHARRHSPDNRNEERRMAPEELAERVFRAYEQRRDVLVPGWANRALAGFGCLAPRAAEVGMRRAILDRLPR